MRGTLLHEHVIKLSTAKDCIYQIRCFASDAELHNIHNLYSLGRTELNILHKRLFLVSWTTLTENQSCSSVRFFQGHTTLTQVQEVQNVLEKDSIQQEKSRIESSSCRCTMTLIGSDKAMKKDVNAIPQMLPNIPKSFPKDIGHSSDLCRKQNSM